MAGTTHKRKPAKRKPGIPHFAIKEHTRTYGSSSLVCWCGAAHPVQPRTSQETYLNPALTCWCGAWLEIDYLKDGVDAMSERLGDFQTAHGGCEPVIERKDEVA